MMQMEETAEDGTKSTSFQHLHWLSLCCIVLLTGVLMNKGQYKEITLNAAAGSGTCTATAGRSPHVFCGRCRECQFVGNKAVIAHPATGAEEEESSTGRDSKAQPCRYHGAFSFFSERAFIFSANSSREADAGLPAHRSRALTAAGRRPSAAVGAASCGAGAKPGGSAALPLRGAPGPRTRAVSAPDGRARRRRPPRLFPLLLRRGGGGGMPGSPGGAARQPRIPSAGADAGAGRGAVLPPSCSAVVPPVRPAADGGWRGRTGLRRRR